MAVPLGKITRGAPLLSVPDGEPSKKVRASVLLSVEYLKVSGPPDRDDFCYIYGYVRISDGRKGKDAVTLFNYDKDSPDAVNLGHHQFLFLNLCDDETARPIMGGSKVHVQMKLWEKLEEDDTQQHQEDPLIADIDYEFDVMCKINQRCFFEFEGDHDFDFSMAYSHIYNGVAAKVQFTIIKDIVPAGEGEEEGGEQGDSTTATEVTGKGKHPTRLIHGVIGATQSINPDELTAINLFYAPPQDPESVTIGSPVELSRNLLVALTGGGCLGIGYSLYNAVNGELITTNAVPLRIERDGGFVTTPEDLTYTQESSDGFVSVSMTLVPCEPPYP